MRLASNMTTVAPQIPEGKREREPGGGGGADRADILRSRIPDDRVLPRLRRHGCAGRATATAKLPDNLTTFRVMAVAVTAGDRYGKGESRCSSLARCSRAQALPRFVRPGDEFIAGAVINHRAGGTPTVQVEGVGHRRRAAW